MNEDKESTLQNFESSLRSLESIVERMKQDQLGLEEMIRLYEEGIARLGTCQKYLEGAEMKIRQLNSRIKSGESNGGENG